MALWHRKRARELRTLWLHILGGKCAWENKGCKGKLTFDCIVPQGHRHHRKMDTYTRMLFYIKQAKHGNIQLLCEAHQAKKSKKEDKQHWAELAGLKEENEPF